MVRQIKPELKAPTIQEIETLAQRAFAAIPKELARHVKNVPIRVEDFPDKAVEKEMDLEDPFELLGLYHGSSLLHKSVLDPNPTVDMIFLYRRPILDYWCETGETLDAVVRHVLIHEIGHHFGFSDEDMERLERED
jgi:predicted Zn-dependent protease with MMP-like domain